MVHRHHDTTSLEKNDNSMRSAIEVHEHLMEILFQTDMISSQYHIVKASKLSRHDVDVSVKCCDVIAGLMFTLGNLVQIGAHPRDMENTPR